MPLNATTLVSLIISSAAFASAEPVSIEPTCPLSTNYFFVYGSLRMDATCNMPWREPWLHGAITMERAHVFGTMRAEYFATVQLSDNKNPIIGSLISFDEKFLDEKVRFADMIEGVPHLYQREMTKATSLATANKSVSAWIYTRVSNGPVVDGGDWVVYQNKLRATAKFDALMNYLGGNVLRLLAPP